MTEQTMTPDEVRAWIDGKISEHEGGRPGSMLELLRQDAISARTAVAALIARNAELEAASIGRDLGEVHALIAENAALTAERDALRETVGLFGDDAQRYQWLVKQAHQKTAYDIYGNGAHWSIGIHSDDQRLNFTEVIDAARAEAVHG